MVKLQLITLTLSYAVARSIYSNGSPYPTTLGNSDGTTPTTNDNMATVLPSTVRPTKSVTPETETLSSWVEVVESAFEQSHKFAEGTTNILSNTGQRDCSISSALPVLALDKEFQSKISSLGMALDTTCTSFLATEFGAETIKQLAWLDSSHMKDSIAICEHLCVNWSDLGITGFTEIRTSSAEKRQVPAGVQVQSYQVNLARMPTNTFVGTAWSIWRGIATNNDIVKWERPRGDTVSGLITLAVHTVQQAATYIRMYMFDFTTYVNTAAKLAVRHRVLTKPPLLHNPVTMMSMIEYAMWDFLINRSDLVAANYHFIATDGTEALIGLCTAYETVPTWDMYAWEALKALRETWEHSWFG
ncbi:hypothetical protein HDV06_000798 [Boothiomyces sp. JEL0866]|nr:hypothetical protein HDV06_000798 [Boothiomyces sp. JEL0866]